MKLFKTLGLAALAALMAMAFIGASSAMAEWTTLCPEESSECEPVEHVHEESVGHAKLLSSFATVECEVLFLGDTLEEGSGAPLKIHGSFTYTCLNGCTAEEENGPAEIKVLKEKTELATVTGEGLVHVVCGLNCRYNGSGLSGHAKGALSAANEVGEISISSATVNKESGFLCPSTSKLDITTESLEAIFIRDMSCEEVTPFQWLFDSNPNNRRCTNMNMSVPQNGRYALKTLQ